MRGTIHNMPEAFIKDGYCGHYEHRACFSLTRLNLIHLKQARLALALKLGRVAVARVSVYLLITLCSYAWDTPARFQGS